MIERLNNIIENIRQKPERVRVRYVWTMTIISVLLIGGVWFTSLSSKFTADSSAFKTDQYSNQDAIDDLNSSIADFKDILDESTEGESSNPFDQSILDGEGNEEARLPQDSEQEGEILDEDEEVISDGEDTPEDINFDELTEEEQEEYLNKQKDKFYDDWEEDLGGGALP